MTYEDEALNALVAQASQSRDLKDDTDDASTLDESEDPDYQRLFMEIVLEQEQGQPSIHTASSSGQKENQSMDYDPT